MATYIEIKELFFQNPEFGFFFLKLVSRRFLQNIARLEAELARRPAGGVNGARSTVWSS